MNLLSITLEIFKGVGSFFGKALPYFLAFKAGKDREKLKNLEREVRDVKEARKIEEDVGNMSHSDVLKFLREHREKKRK